MHQAVLSYDATVTRVSSEHLLLNIVRPRFNRPVHFTTVSSVPATFDFRVTAGITPPEGEVRGLLGPVFNTTVAENLTVTIIPMDGAQFELLGLLEFGGDLGMALGMMGASMRSDGQNGQIVVRNEPRVPIKYEKYRRRSLHLSAKHQLFIEPIMVEQVWSGSMQQGLEPDDVLKAVERSYRWKKVGENQYVLNKVRVRLARFLRIEWIP